MIRVFRWQKTLDLRYLRATSLVESRYLDSYGAQTHGGFWSLLTSTPTVPDGGSNLT